MVARTHSGERPGCEWEQEERLEGRSEGEKRRPLQHGECKDGEDKSSRQAGREGT